MSESIVPQESNNIQVTTHDRGDHRIFVCNKTNQPYANLAELEKIFPAVPKTTMHRRLKGVPLLLLKVAKIDTDGGLQGVPLYPAQVILDLAFEFDLALAKAIGTAGATLYLYGLGGYKVEVAAPNTVEADRQHLEVLVAPKPKLSEIKQTTKMFEYLHGKSYAQRYYAQMVGKHYPALTGAQPTPEEKASLPTAKSLLTPTQIAVELGWYCKSNNTAGDARKVNSELARLGYQEPIVGKWSATNKAINLNLVDRKPVETNSRSQKDQLLWSADIVSILQEFKVA